ncbi:10585_t:CDS:2, partial [Funneliformis mosseae]
YSKSKKEVLQSYSIFNMRLDIQEKIIQALFDFFLKFLNHDSSDKVKVVLIQMRVETRLTILLKSAKQTSDPFFDEC